MAAQSVKPLDKSREIVYNYDREPGVNFHSAAEGAAYSDLDPARLTPQGMGQEYAALFAPQGYAWQTH